MFNWFTRYRVASGSHAEAPWIVSTRAPASSPTPPIGCVYTLNASASELQLLGLSGQLTLSNNDQTGTSVITSGGSGQNLGMAPAGISTGTAATIPLNSGKVQFEVKTPSWQGSATTGTGNSILLSAGLVSSDFSQQISFLLGVKLGGGFSYSMTINGSTALASVTVPTCPQVFTLGFDSTTNTVALKVDGVTQTLAISTYTKDPYVFFASLSQSTGLAAGDTGKSYAVTFVSDESNIQYPFTGYTDLCGNS